VGSQLSRARHSDHVGVDINPVEVVAGDVRELGGDCPTGEVRDDGDVAVLRCREDELAGAVA